MKKKKIIATALVLALVLVIGATMAYFTDKDTATNKFTIGNVDIKIQEPEWEKLTDDDKVVVPGKTLKKDPQVKNIGTSDAYIFVKVTNADINGKPAFAWDPEVSTGWAPLKTDDGSSVYYYVGSSEGSTLAKLGKNDTTSTLFETVTFNSNIETADVNEYKKTRSDLKADLLIEAYAIQADDLDTTDPAAVWAKFSA